MAFFFGQATNYGTIYCLQQHFITKSCITIILTKILIFSDVRSNNIFIKTYPYNHQMLITIEHL